MKSRNIYGILLRIKEKANYRRKTKPQTAVVTSCVSEVFPGSCPDLYCDWFSAQFTFQNQIKVFTVYLIHSSTKKITAI